MIFKRKHFFAMNRISILLILLLSAATLQGFAQKKIKSPDLKAAIRYPYVFGNTENGTEHNKITGFPSLSAEKPFPIEYKRRSRFSINPGLAYYMFKDDEVKGNIYYSGETLGTDVVGQDNKLTHHSVNGYVKFLVQAKMQGKTTAFVYFGGITGFHFLTKSIGTRTIYSNNAADPFDELKINESGEDFFNPFYYGAVLGFQPNAKTTNIIKPSFEAKFYPGMVKRRVRNNFVNEKIVEVSVMMGFHR